jgi:RNA polymerase sigma-70 factor (ECF subfamily)
LSSSPSSERDPSGLPGSSSSAERFVRLFTACERRIRAFVRRLVPTQPDADDVMQEIAMVLWRKFDSFRADGDFLAWAIGIAKFEVLAWRRDKARDREWLSGALIEILADQSIVDESRLGRQRESLAGCLGRLSAVHRELLLAAYRPGARIQDVALQSGRSVGGFYQWLHRMKKMLLDCVRAEMTKNSLSSGNSGVEPT